MGKKKNKKKEKKVRVTPKVVTNICDVSYANPSIIIASRKFNKHLFKNRKKIIKLLKEYIEVADKYSSISSKFRIFTSPALDVMTFFKKASKPSKFSDSAFFTLYISFVTHYLNECKEREECIKDLYYSGEWDTKTKHKLEGKINLIFSKFVKLTYFDVFGMSFRIISTWHNNYPKQLAELCDNHRMKYIINAIPDIQAVSLFHNERDRIMKEYLLNTITNLGNTIKLIQPSLVNNFEGGPDTITNMTEILDSIVIDSASAPSAVKLRNGEINTIHSSLSKRSSQLIKIVDLIVNSNSDDDSITDTSEDSEEWFNSTEDNDELGRCENTENSDDSDDVEDDVIDDSNNLKKPDEYLGMPLEDAMKVMDEMENMTRNQ